jgi:hypothetical protein
MDITTLTAQEREVLDAEDRRLDDPDIDWEEIIADWDAEQRGEGPPPITVRSLEEFRALVRRAEQELDAEG